MFLISNRIVPLLLGISVTHGPIIGDLTSSSVRIWIRCEHPILVPIHLDGGRGAVSRDCALFTRSSRDNTGYVQILNLEPDTKYSYTVDGKNDDAWWFKTRPKNDEKCRIAFGSCADEEEGSASVWDRIDQENATAIVLLGDTPYIDTTDLAMQRKRYQAFSTVPAFSKLVSHTPLYSTWDDHDFGRNDTDGNLEGKENSRQAFSEYRPNPTVGENEEGVYTSFSQGLVEVFLLDTRWFAGTESNNGVPTLLGNQQWAWIEKSLRASTSPYKVLACGIVFNSAVRPLKKDYWGAYPTEYARLLDLISKTKSTGVMLVSGDIHWSRVIRHETEEMIGYDLYEFITSPIHDKTMSISDAPHKGLIYSQGEPNSFLLLEAEVAPRVEGDMQTLTMSFKNAGGKTLHKQTFTHPPGRLSSTF